MSLRPDIFNQALTVIMIEIILWRFSLTQPEVAEPGFASGGASGAAAKALDWTFILVLSAIAALWANLHCLFVLCFVHLGFANLSSILAPERELDTSKSWPANVRKGRLAYFRAIFSQLDHILVVAMIACFAATCINPYGIGLWLMLPSIFLNPINTKLNEQQSLALSQGSYLSLIPFIILVILNCICAVRALVAVKNKSSLIRLELVIFALLQFGFATWLTCTKTRFIACGQ